MDVKKGQRYLAPNKEFILEALESGGNRPIDCKVVAECVPNPMYNLHDRGRWSLGSFELLKGQEAPEV